MLDFRFWILDLLSLISHLFLNFVQVRFFSIEALY